MQRCQLLQFLALPCLEVPKDRRPQDLWGQTELGSNFQPHFFMAVWPWTSHATSLRLIPSPIKQQDFWWELTSWECVTLGPWHLVGSH